MLMTNAKKIVGIVLLVIGSIWFVLFISVGYMFTLQGWGPVTPWGFIFHPSTFIGLVCIIPGLVLLLTSRKKYSKSPDKSITK
jgi:hypothetical protein